jgi:hypothetical protein
LPRIYSAQSLHELFNTTSRLVKRALKCQRAYCLAIDPLDSDKIFTLRDIGSDSTDGVRKGDNNLCGSTHGQIDPGSKIELDISAGRSAPSNTTVRPLLESGTMTTGQVQNLSSESQRAQPSLGGKRAGDDPANAGKDGHSTSYKFPCIDNALGGEVLPINSLLLVPIKIPYALGEDLDRTFGGRMSDKRGFNVFVSFHWPRSIIEGRWET